MQDGDSVLHFFCHNGRVASRLPFNGSQDHAALVPSAQLPPKKILHCGSVRHFSAARLPLCVFVEGIPPNDCEVVSGDAAGVAGFCCWACGACIVSWAFASPAMASNPAAASATINRDFMIHSLTTFWIPRGFALFAHPSVALAPWKGIEYAWCGRYLENDAQCAEPRYGAQLIGARNRDIDGVCELADASRPCRVCYRVRG
jgi:hypothetical protein